MDGKLSQEERTGGKDQQLSGAATEGTAAIAMSAVGQIDLILRRVRELRIHTDMEEGWFRDYPDWKPVVHVGESPRSWRDLLFFASLPLDGYAAKGQQDKIEGQLLRIAEIAVSWLEAIHRRKDERRMQTTRASWWARLKYRLTGRFS